MSDREGNGSGSANGKHLAWRLVLFVAGTSPQSRQALTDLDKVLEDCAPSAVDIEIVDLIEDPDSAIDHDILAIPTLIRESPLPRLRIIGDLTNKERVWSMLRV